MKTLRITSAALAIALGMGISSTSHAFMASPVEAQSTQDKQVTTTIEDIRAEIALGETKTDVMVAKIDAFVKHIDLMLDEGVENENLYLAAREEAITLRQSLPGLDEHLAGLEGPVSGGDMLVGLHGGHKLPSIGGGGIANSGHHVFHGGGGAGGGVAGGRSGLALLGTIGLAVGIPLAVSNDDSPGPPASQSQMGNAN